MLIKRAILFSVFAYVITFGVGILATGFITLESAETLSDIIIPNSFYYLQIAIAGLVSGFFTWLYFRARTISPSLAHGFYFGLVGLAIGLLFDVLLFIPPVLSGEAVETLLSFYLNPLFWVALSVYVAVASIVGFSLQRHHARGRLEEKTES